MWSIKHGGISEGAFLARKTGKRKRRLLRWLHVRLIGRNVTRHAGRALHFALLWDVRSDAVTGHRDGPHRIAPHQRLSGALARCRETRGVKQRDEMIGCRNCHRIVRMLAYLE